jgi:Tfp pilus assembly protein PilF
VIASFSEKYAPYLNRGTIFLQLSLLSQALADFNRAIEIDPRDPTAYYNRAIVRMKENRLEDALSDLFVALSCMYLQKGIQTREIKYLTKAISLVDNNVYAHIERGKLYNIQGNYVLAENDFSSAVELDPSNSEAYALRGSLYRDLKQEENATKDLKQVLALTQ